MSIVDHRKIRVTTALRLMCLVALCLLGACSRDAIKLPFKDNANERAQHSVSGREESGTGNQISEVKLPYAPVIELSDEQQKTAGIRERKVSLSGVEAGVLELSSTVESPADKTGIVYSPAGGVVTRVLVDVGDTVRKGQVVAYVNSPDISDAQAAYLDALAKLSEARAQIQAVNARIEVSNSNVNRMQQLNKEGIASKKDVENARLTLLAVESEQAVAVGKLNAARAHIEAEKVKLRALGLKPPGDENSSELTSRDFARLHASAVTSELPIRSPVSGVVVRKDVNPGQNVGPATMAGSASSAGNAANRQNSMMTIADLHRVWVMLEVPQREVPKVKIGGLVDFKTESFPGKSFTGKITRIAEIFDPQSRTAQYRAEIDNPGGLLKPGMLIIAELQLNDGNGGMTVPPEAVQTLANKNVVFVRQGANRFAVREVRCGERSDKGVMIETGLSPGDTVVVAGTFYLKSAAMRSQIGEGVGTE